MSEDFARQVAAFAVAQICQVPARHVPFFLFLEDLTSVGAAVIVCLIFGTNFRLHEIRFTSQAPCVCVCMYLR